MIFDVMIKEVEKNAAGKDVINVFRVRDSSLSVYLRQVQDSGKYIISVIPLFRSKLKDVILNHVRDNIIIDDEDKVVSSDFAQSDFER